jgi:glyoxylase-like metal-dependent hydrolase (beta-lactamase superfamily II)
MNLERIVTGAFQQNCYLACDADRGSALVFDPGDDAERIDAALEALGLEVAAYVCTHGHADHISALAELHGRRPAPVLMHSSDLAWAFGPRNRIEPYYDAPGRPDTADLRALEAEREWRMGGFHFQCIETPGHSPGSCCLLFPAEGALIAGDTLFKGSCGRTDLPGGDPRKLRESLNRLKQLADETRVYPGHGPDTTIGIERRTNFYMQ